ncbi:hypothetical protein PGTUg99_013840 [Puccinia graminis f. sp. tritici]|uniref:Tet-like 2OG-Fe(II) oxygenase domain-containing protein n=1 Tax=Puccinia graminis f. sp. tritici TaxID=56615 RepID=A0A5B0M8W3_PUCGR|nr:hypothetical protein PGTUg99_013840 [Puccinia graminis f. sp. tritici]
MMENEAEVRVPPRNAMKSKARKRRRMNERHSIVSLDINEAGFQGQKIIWSMRTYQKLHLYPQIHSEKKKPARHPSKTEINEAQKIADKFHCFHHGKVIIIDRTDSEVVQFIPLNQLTPQEKADINLVTTFLHKSRKFVNPIAPARTWGVGWRKCMKALELFGRYIKLRIARAFPNEYFSLAAQSVRVSSILGEMFKSLGHIPFESNRQLMQENEIPSFASGKFNTHLSQLDCAPHITFTSNGFYNRPHRDKGDASEFAFGLFVPTKTSDGTLVDPIVDASLIKDSTGGRFIFPDYQFCIKFKPDVVVKVVWAAKRCKH